MIHGYRPSVSTKKEVYRDSKVHVKGSVCISDSLEQRFFGASLGRTVDR